LGSADTLDYALLAISGEALTNSLEAFLVHT
jgi:hypothetical protein